MLDDLSSYLVRTLSLWCCSRSPPANECGWRRTSGRTTLLAPSPPRESPRRGPHNDSAVLIPPPPRSPSPSPALTPAALCPSRNATPSLFPLSATTTVDLMRLRRPASLHCWRLARVPFHLHVGRAHRNTAYHVWPMALCDNRRQRRSATTVARGSVQQSLPMAQPATTPTRACRLAESPLRPRSLQPQA